MLTPPSPYTPSPARPTSPSVCQPLVDPVRTSIAPVSVPRASCERITAAAIAKFFLKARAQIAGPFIGGGVRIAVMQDTQRPVRLAFLMTIELLEKRNQRSCVFDGNIGSVGDLHEYAFVRFRAGLRAYRRGVRNDSTSHSLHRYGGRCRDFFHRRFHRRFLG